MEHNYLIHHGILGQKWGKKNGPPYPLALADHSAAERKHLDKRDIQDAVSKTGKAAKAGADTYAGIRKTISQKDNYEKAKTMSDEELKKEIERLRLEQEFVRLTSSDIERGQAYAKTALETTMAAATFVTTMAGAIIAIKKVIK